MVLPATSCTEAGIDVYKRQRYTLACRGNSQETAPSAGAGHKAHTPQLVYTRKPVSYTHLDVYKRQEHNQSPRSSARLR